MIISWNRASGPHLTFEPADLSIHLLERLTEGHSKADHVEKLDTIADIAFVGTSGCWEKGYPQMTMHTNVASRKPEEEQRVNFLP